MEKNKKKKTKKWIRPRHKFYFWILRIVFYPILKIRYKYVYKREDKAVPKKCIIMCNHQATLDPAFMILPLHRPIYFIMSEDLFTLGPISSIIRHVIAPISKAKSKSDINTIRQTLKVLGEGGTVAIYPSGNRSLSGKEWHIDFSTAKLVKMAKAPLVLYNICGCYGSDPRWGKGVRKGKTTMELKKVISAEQIQEMSLDEIYNEIVTALDVDDRSLNVNFKSKRSAEFVERALYYCPHCHSFNTLTSKGKILSCKNCDFKAEYGEDLLFKQIEGELPYSTIREWFDAQQIFLKERAGETDQTLFSDELVLSRTIKDFKRDKKQKSSISANRDGVIVKTESGKVYDVKFNEIYGATILGKRKINFYLPDDIVLQIKGNETFNSVKYLHLYECTKEADK